MRGESEMSEAMKQALEALVRADRISGHPNNGKTITALRAAIAEAAMQRLTDVQQEMEHSEDVLEMVEPVAWMTKFEDQKPRFRLTLEHATGWGSEPIPLYTAPPPRREWVGLTDEEMRELSHEHRFSDDEHILAIMTALKEKNS